MVDEPKYTVMKKIKYFTLSELLHSSTANRLHIDNIPSFEVVDNLNRLAYYLDGIRTKYGKPLTITSGFRSIQLNKVVGGVTNSQHTKGLAADIVCDDMNKLFSIIQETGDFDQLIMEHRTGSSSQWVHVSIAPTRSTPRKQVFSIQK